MQKYLTPDGPLPPDLREALADEAVDYALERAFERRSTAYAHNVYADAMRFGGAARCMPEDIEEALKRREGLIFGTPDSTHRQLLTTQEIVEQERKLMALVRDGRGTTKPLVEQPRIDRQLSAEQMAAVTHVLSSTDQVVAIRGQAGVGKSFLLNSLVKELDRNHVDPVALAPTVAASRGALREAGLSDANTLAMFMSDSKDGRALRDKAKDGVIVLDEAGLTSTPDMLRLVEKAHDLHARVLLVGDTRQLASVERGDALRLLEDDGLVPAELQQIRRQTNETYKAVVEKMAAGDAAEGLQKAQASGFVIELQTDLDEGEDAEVYEAKVDQLAAEEAARRVASAYEANRSTLVISPTHALGRTVTAAIREELQTKGLIGEDEATITLLRQVDKCIADRRDAAHALEDGDLAVMRRDDEARGLQMGEVLRAKMDDSGKIHLFQENWRKSRVGSGLDPRAYAVFRNEEVPGGHGRRSPRFRAHRGYAAGRPRNHRAHRPLVSNDNADRWAGSLDGLKVPRSRLRGDHSRLPGTVRRSCGCRRHLVVSGRDVKRGDVRRCIPWTRAARHHHR